MPHGPRFDLREQRCVARIDAELTQHAGKHDELRVAREDLLFGADDVDAIVLAMCQSSTRMSRHCSVFAFSKASSIAPTM
jgi:hypothetical protein